MGANEEEEEIARGMDEIVFEGQEESKWVDIEREYTEGE